MITRRQFQKLSFSSLFLSGIKGCVNLDRTELKLNSPVANPETFILWERGYLPGENQGILQLVAAWKRFTGRKLI